MEKRRAWLVARSQQPKRDAMAEHGELLASLAPVFKERDEAILAQVPPDQREKHPLAGWRLQQHLRNMRALEAHMEGLRP